VNPRTRDFIDNLARTPLSVIVWLVVAATVIRFLVYPYLKNTPVHKRAFGYFAAKFVNELVDALIYAGVFVFMLIRPFAIQAFLIPSGSMWPTLRVNDFIVANKAIYRYTDPKVNDVVVFRPPNEAAIRDTDLDSEHNMKIDFVKRCIGLPGQVIEMRNGILYRNGQPDPVDDKHKHLSECIDNSDPENCQDYRELPDAQKAGLQLPSFKLVKYHNKIIPFNYTPGEGNSATSTQNYSVAKEYVVPDPSEEQDLIKQVPQPLPTGMYLMMGDNRNNSFDGRGWGLVPREQIIGRAEFVWWPLAHMGRAQ